MKRTLILSALMAALSTAYPLHAATVRTATETFVTNRIATATNAVYTAAKDYTDDAIASAGGVTPEMVTNIVNDVAPAPGDYATVSNRAMTALQSFREIDPTVPAWAKSQTQPLPPDYNSVSNKAYGALQRSGGVVEYLQVNMPLAIKKSGGTTLYTYDGVRLSENVKLIYPNTDGRLALESHTPNNITRTATDATLVHTDGGSTTNLITIRQASETLAGLMTAADKVKLDAATTPADVTAAIREQSLGGIWDKTLQVWWTPRMRNGSLTYEATTNVNLNAEN